MRRPYRLVLALVLAGLAISGIRVGAAAPAPETRYLVRILTADRDTLASLRRLLPPVRILDGSPGQPGFALAWGDGKAVEAARRDGAGIEVLGSRRSDRSYAVVYRPFRPDGPIDAGDPEWVRLGRILYEDARLAILEYPPDRHDLLLDGSEILPIPDRPVILPSSAEKTPGGGLPPLPASADPAVQAYVDGVSADSLLSVVLYLQDLVSRRSSEPGSYAAADYLSARLGLNGIPDVSLYDFDVYSDDVVGIQRGLISPDELYIICGHYDSTSRGSRAPGADDNATGTAAVVEASRLLGRHQFQATIVYLAFSGEEQGLLGSEAWAAWARANNLDIRGVINLDMVGWRRADDPTDLDLISDNDSSELHDFVYASAAAYVPDYSVVDGRFGGGNSDQQSFWDHGYKAVTFNEDSNTNNPCYHTDQDLIGPSVNDPEFFRHNVQVAVAALADLARPVQVQIAQTPLEDPAATAPRYPVQARITSQAPLVPDSLFVRYRVNGSAFSALPLTRQKVPDFYGADLPKEAPGDVVEYYLEAQDELGRRTTDPTGAPDVVYGFMVGRETVFHDGFSADQGWTVGAPGDSAASGVWERVRPIGTGSQADADADGDSLCFVTGNGTPEGSPGDADVDGGRTTLTSPRLDLAGSMTADLAFQYWFVDESFPDDSLLVSLSSDDGATWTRITSVTESNRRWFPAQVPRIEQVLPLTGAMRIRFSVADVGRSSLLEAAIDAVRVRAVATPLPPPPGPSVTVLMEPYPQPFNRSLTIRYDLAHAGDVDLAIFDVQGRRVAGLVHGYRPVDRYTASWDGRGGDGRALPSGVYFLRLAAGGGSYTRRLIRVR